MIMKYECPKCKTVVTSDKKLEYCICGEKYPQFNFSSLFGTTDFTGIFDDLNEKYKK